MAKIDFNKKCAECGKRGATESGMCLHCFERALNPDLTMKSKAGRLVQERLKKAS
jgi:hypothetical protein